MAAGGRLIHTYIYIYSLTLPFFLVRRKVQAFLRRILFDLLRVGCVLLYFEEDFLLPADRRMYINE